MMDTEEKSKDELEKLKYVLSQSEISFKDTLDICDGLDRKASMFFSVFLTVAAGSGSILAIHYAGLSSASQIFLGVLSFGLLIAAVFFAISLMPGTYQAPGSPAKRWKEDGYFDKVSARQLWEGELTTNDLKTEHNIKKNKSKAALIETGLFLTLITLFVAALAWLIQAI